jgi:hypothetical protein
VNASVNGATVSYGINGQSDGEQVATATFHPIYADSGSSITCAANPVTLVGYLTPVPAG